jgi:hypothetical protein
MLVLAIGLLAPSVMPLDAQIAGPARTLDGSSILEPQPTERSHSTEAGTASSGERKPDIFVGKQPKRILWVIPNYRAVSARTQLPPLSRKDKFRLTAEDSFDYSSFVLAGMIAGISQARNSTPEFNQGAAGFGRYYWHTYTDEVVGNVFTEALFPVILHQDPRYYTLGPGAGFLHRTEYAFTRLVITRTDAGRNAFNTSEILGNALGAGVSDLYYPRQQGTLNSTAEKWVLQLGIDAAFNVAKEFWPDIDHFVFRGYYSGNH